MITFTRTNNSVEIDFGSTELEYVSTEAVVRGKTGDSVVYIANTLKTGNRINYDLVTTDIQNRPSDDAAIVATWLRDTFFYGPNYAVGGGGWPLDYANTGNQTTQIARLDTIITNQGTQITNQGTLNTNLVAFSDKSGASDITDYYDEVEVTYRITAPIGEIDAVIFKDTGIEVARRTLSYNGSGDLTGFVTT
jgi:hypothetical protein